MVALKEFSYASAHPHAHGPANAIAWGAVAGALLSAAVAIAVNALRPDPRNNTVATAGPRQPERRGIRRYLTPKSICAAVAVVLVLIALSPAVQGYHVGRSGSDTACVTRLLVQLCKDEHARLAREQATSEAKESAEREAVETRECHAVAKEAEEGKRRLFGPENYYWRCLQPGKQGLEHKWERERQREEEGDKAQTQHEGAQKKAQLESEAASLKAEAKSLTEEGERLTNESKIDQSVEKGEEARKTKEAGEKKLEEAQASG